jgi:hypothetical protein
MGALLAWMHFIDRAVKDIVQPVAIQHELKYLTLDDHINLGNYQFDAFYKQAQVKVTGLADFKCSRIE